jgi:hypothetical protein
MYDILLSTHCIRDWDARPDPITELLEYRPFLYTGDAKPMASVPIQDNPVQGMPPNAT